MQLIDIGVNLTNPCFSENTKPFSNELMQPESVSWS